MVNISSLGYVSIKGLFNVGLDIKVIKVMFGYEVILRVYLDIRLI